MKGLLLKDWYQMVAHFRLMGLLAVLFLGFSLMDGDSLYFLVLLSLIASKLPITLLAYDERDHWEGYAAALPYTRRQLVSAKYLMGLLIGGGLCLLAVVLQGGKMLLTGSWDGQGLLGLFSAMVLVNLLAAALSMPFCFKLGTEKGRMAQLVVIVVACGGAVAVMFASNSMDIALIQGYSLPLAFGMAAAVVIYALSWLISSRIYERREM